MPSLTISYATRLNAEQAMQRGRFFKEKQMQMTWVTANGATIAAKPVETTVVSDSSQEQQTMVVEAASVDDDDEEQEESRSWRR